MCTLLQISSMTFGEVDRVGFPATTWKSKVGKIYTNHGGSCNWDQLSKGKNSVYRSLNWSGKFGLDGSKTEHRVNNNFCNYFISISTWREGKGTSLSRVECCSWVEQQQYFWTANKKPWWGVVQITQNLVLHESVLQICHWRWNCRNSSQRWRSTLTLNLNIHLPVRLFKITKLSK